METEKQLTTYEKLTGLRRIIVNRAAEVMNYTNWSDDFAAKQIREIPALDRLREHFGEINIAELTAAQMDELGFGRWDDSGLRLIPLWMFQFLPAEIKTTNIEGATTLKKADMDNDHRFGCLAYGVFPVDLKK